MYAGVRKTPAGYRMACPNGHTDLIVRRLPNSPLSAPQIFCPHCHNPNGSMQPVCSIRQLKEFALRDCGGDTDRYQEMLRDMSEYFERNS